MDKINFIIHIPIILILVAVQMALPDLTANYFLKAIETKARSQGLAVFESDNFHPRPPEAPKSFKFVVVTGDKKHKEEKYVSYFGDTTTLIYDDGTLHTIQSNSLMSWDLVLPIGVISILLIAIGSLGRVIRTGKLIGLDYNNTEILFQLYGFSMFMASIFMGIRTG